MGYYYDFHIEAVLSKDLTVHGQRIIHLFSLLIVEKVSGKDIQLLPDHKFFDNERWIRLFHHHAGHEPPEFYLMPTGYYKLVLRGSINYGYDEIQEFISFISPYVAGRKKKQYLGWYKGEENREHINLYKEWI